MLILDKYITFYLLLHNNGVIFMIILNLSGIKHN